MCWWANTALPAQQEATIVRKWLHSLQEPTAAFCCCSTGSLSPACPSSSLYFHTQVIKSVSQFCDLLHHTLFLFFCCPLSHFFFFFLPSSLLLAGLFLGWGGRGWGRNREKKKKNEGRGVTFAALWLTTCVSGPLYLHVSHGKQGDGRGWRERKDRHMVLVCRV